MYISEYDKTLIRQLIEKQLQALQQKDLETAFTLLSPTIQSQLQPENFMAMVKNRYSAVLEYRSIIFREFTLVDSYPALVAIIMDRAGDLVKVVFVVQHQLDYSWRIHGYELLTVDGKAI